METVFKKELYGRGKNDQLKIWGITVKKGLDDCGYIVIKHQTGEEGKPIEHLEAVREGKNIGRSNETTPLEQALSQAKSKVKLQLDRGYKEEIPAEGERTNALGYPMPMLATPLEKINGDLGDVFYIQPKLDGFRCLAFKDEEGEIHLYTRRGKRVETLPHLEEAYRWILRPGDHVDGELYLHGEPLQRIASLVKRLQPGSEKIEHHLYDTVSEFRFSDRFHKLSEIFKSTTGPVTVVETVSCSGMESAEYAFRSFRERGYEGAILRTNDTPYEIGARSKSLIKMKGFEEEDFEIVGMELAKPKHKNGETLNVAVLTCLTPEGQLFKVTAPGNERDKHTIWDRREEVLGSKAEIKFANKVKKTGIPFHPVCIKIKDGELD